MQFMTEDFKRLVKDRLKVGDLAKPVCRVEVDKMVFLPGKVDKLILEEFKMDTEVRVERQWIVPNSDGSYTGSTAMPTDGIVFPVQGLGVNDVTSPFGMRSTGMHNGVDFAPKQGQYPLGGMGLPILSVWSGTVSSVITNSASAGKYVVVDHDNGKRTRYLHLHKIDVRQGQKVEAGTKLGEMGNTGAVRAGGAAVTGTVDNPNTPRGKGLGTHLHFEIQESNGKGGYDKVDPMPYLKAKTNASKPSVAEGEGAFIGPMPLVGVPGRVVAREEFLLRNWHERPTYTFGNGYHEFTNIEIKDVGGVSNWGTTKFNDSAIASKLETHFTISVRMVTEGFLSLSFRSNFNVSEGDAFYIETTPGQRAANVTQFDGIDKLQELNKIYLPKGQLRIKFGIKWGGKFGKKNPPVPGGPVANNEFKQLSLGKIMIQEIDKTTEAQRNIYGQAGYDVSQEEFSNLQGGYWEETEVEDFIFSSAPQTFDLAVGDFVFSETMVLDNVMNVDIATSLEQDSSEAVITLANVNGYYSPDFNPHSFPELGIRTPFSTVMAGFQVGILSNNTPIRIYMGYGNNRMRVFTGLIDKTDVTGNPPTITITARDMYKKISDKVLTETKRYPDVNYIDNLPINKYTGGNEFVESISPAIQAISNANSILPSIATAQAILESGWGKHFKENNIYGIKKGSSWTGPTFDSETTEYVNGKPVKKVQTFRAYGSLEESVQDHQKLLTTLPRYAPVLAAKDYKEAARALQTAGYATDPEYANKLISIIESNGLAELDAVGKMTTMSEPDNDETPTPVSEGENEKVAWLKSAVVQDLVAHAGMFDWRAHAEDLQYPDAIIEESYLIAIDQIEGTFIRAIPGKEGEFETVKLDSIKSPKGWMNPYTDEYGRTFMQYDIRIGEAISTVLEDTHYRSYCDRYGTYRLETPNYNKAVSETYRDSENIMTIEKTIDFSRARSHLIIRDENDMMSSFMDKEILMEVKGELRTASIEVPWAKTYELKKVVASRLFQDMKRVCRTLQVATPCNPAMDVLDRIRVYDRNTSTNAVYTIKGIRRSYSPESGLIQFLELFWSEDGVVV